MGMRSRRSEEHTSELQSHLNLVCRLLLEKKKKRQNACMALRRLLLCLDAIEAALTITILLQFLPVPSPVLRQKKKAARTRKSTLLHFTASLLRSTTCLRIPTSVSSSLAVAPA